MGNYDYVRKCSHDEDYVLGAWRNRPRALPVHPPWGQVLRACARSCSAHHHHHEHHRHLHGHRHGQWNLHRLCDRCKAPWTLLSPVWWLWPWGQGHSQGDFDHNVWTWMTILMKILMTMLMLMVPSKKPTNRVLFISVIPPRCCSHSHYCQTTIRKKQLGTIPNILDIRCWHIALAKYTYYCCSHDCEEKCATISNILEVHKC